MAMKLAMYKYMYKYINICIHMYTYICIFQIMAVVNIIIREHVYIFLRNQRVFLGGLILTTPSELRAYSDAQD